MQFGAQSSVETGERVGGVPHTRAGLEVRKNKQNILKSLHLFLTCM